MFFWLKKSIGYMLTPVPAMVLLLVVGVLLLRSQRRRRAGTILIGLATLLLLLSSNKFVSANIVRPLEMKYQAVPDFVHDPVPAELAACRYVAVLGAGHGNTPGLAALNQLSPSARARITEGVRILLAVPEAKLLVSGPGIRRKPTHATKLERAAISLGIDPARIERIEIVRDTEDESLAVKKIAGDAPVALVTSAWHMPRSVALFRSAGVNIVPCPTDYTAHFDGYQWRDILFDVESIERTTFGVRERIGYLWIWLRGKTRPAGTK